MAKEYAEAIKLHKALEDVLKIDRGETESRIKKSIKVQTSDSYRRQAAQQLMALDVPEAPPEKRFVTSDCTAEKMGEICAANPDGILVNRDE